MVKFLKKLKTKNFVAFKANFTLRSRSRSLVFELFRDLYMINIWFKFEGKIQNTSKVIVFTRIHTDDDTDDDDDDGTKNNMSPPGRT